MGWGVPGAKQALSIRHPAEGSGTLKQRSRSSWHTSRVQLNASLHGFATPAPQEPSTKQRSPRVQKRPSSQLSPTLTDQERGDPPGLQTSHCAPGRLAPSARQEPAIRQYPPDNALSQRSAPSLQRSIVHGTPSSHERELSAVHRPSARQVSPVWQKSPSSHLAPTSRDQRVLETLGRQRSHWFAGFSAPAGKQVASMRQPALTVDSHRSAASSQESRVQATLSSQSLADPDPHRASALQTSPKVHHRPSSQDTPTRALHATASSS